MRIQFMMICLVLGVSGAAQATLFDRGGGMIFDDELNITWLQDANMGGSMNWTDSLAWADNLVFGGFDDWRLPSMDLNMDDSIVACLAVGQIACRDNELAYMYHHNLGGLLGDDLTGDQGPFSNIQLLHWSSTDLITPGSDLRYVFVFDNGGQGVSDISFEYGAWAVRPGDVMAAVPEPGTPLLIGLGLAALGLGLVRRRQRGI